MLPRTLTPAILAALADTPVVLLQGPRQSGKSTLAETLAGASNARYVTLDDISALAASRADPVGFLDSLGPRAVLDEVQRNPDLFIPLKAAVDRDRRPGRFLLTGSAKLLALPRLAESLAGRMEVVTLWPFSQGEIERRVEGFIDAVFETRLPLVDGISEKWPDYAARLVQGGYPEVVQRATEDRRRAWFSSYISTVLQRDVRDIADVEDLTAFPHLLKLLATRTASLLNFSDLARDARLASSTLKRYLALLEATFLVQRLPAWSVNLSKRLVKSPKLLFIDCGLAAAVLGFDEARVRDDRTAAGPLLETFVAMELVRQSGWSRVQPSVHHFRAYSGQEVDIVLEDRRGRVVGIEVKASASLGERDFGGLKTLQAELGDRFLRGIVLYTGGQSLPFGPNLHAWPLATLWRMGDARPASSADAV